MLRTGTHEWVNNRRLINQFAMRLRHTSAQGVQLIIVGDFFQLPPVIAFDTNGGGGGHSNYNNNKSTKRFCFQSTAWLNGRFKMVNLEENFRQSKDDVFRGILSNVRRGILSAEDEKILRTRIVKPLSYKDGPEDGIPSHVTRIFSRKVAVEERNNKELNKIDGPKCSYKGYFYDAFPPKNINGEGGKSQQPYVHPLLKSIPTAEVIELKKGALVLLCFNIDVSSGLYNGTAGEVVGFSKVYMCDDQGVYTEEDVYEDRHYNIKTIIPEKYIQYPIVKFDNGDTRTIYPHTWESRHKKKILASYTNIPLILRYAITTHKSQGQTLPNALIDMSSFEPGQCYTALSRVGKLEDLYIINFTSKGVFADKNVISFYTNNNLF